MVESEETSKFIEDRVFTSEYDTCTVYDNRMGFLPHICINAFLVNNPDGAFRCQKIDDFRVNNDNTKDKFIPLPNDYSVSCLK